MDPFWPLLGTFCPLLGNFGIYGTILGPLANGFFTAVGFAVSLGGPFYHFKGLFVVKIVLFEALLPFLRPNYSQNRRPDTFVLLLGPFYSQKRFAGIVSGTLEAEL